MNDLYEKALYYLGTVWNRRRMVCLVAAVVCFAGWVIVVLIPDTYQSSARIYVDTTNVLYRELLTGITVENNIGDHVRVMQKTLLSSANLKEVARVAGYAMSDDSPAETDQLLKVLKLRTTITASQENIFAISHTDTEAQRSYDVVVALLDMFVKSQLGESQEELDAAEAFIDDQLKTYEEMLRQAENRRAEFKRRNLRLLPEAGQGGFLGSATSAQTALKQINLELRQAYAERNILRRELAAVPEYLASDFGAAEGPPSYTSYQLLEAEAKLKSLLSGYTENHPDVIAAQRRVDELLADAEAELAQATEFSDLQGETVGGLPNPLYHDLKLRLVEQNSKIGSLEEKRKSLHQDAERLNSFAAEIPMIEAQLQQLDRDYSIIKRKHDELLNRRESARLSRAREKRGEEVSYRLIESPTVPTEPSAPDRPLLYSAVLVLGVVAGIAFAIGLDLIDSTFSSVKDLKQRINLPVYGRVLEVKGFGATARLSADHLVLFLFVISLLSVYLTLMAFDSHVGFTSLSQELATPESLIGALDPLQSKLPDNLM